MRSAMQRRLAVARDHRWDLTRNVRIRDGQVAAAHEAVLQHRAAGRPTSAYEGTRDAALEESRAARRQVVEFEAELRAGYLPPDPHGASARAHGRALRRLIGTAPRRGHRVRAFVRSARRGGGRPRARAARASSASSGGGDPGPGGDPEPPGEASEPGGQDDAREAT